MSSTAIISRLAKANAMRPSDYAKGVMSDLSTQPFVATTQQEQANNQIRVLLTRCHHPIFHLRLSM